MPRPSLRHAALAAAVATSSFAAAAAGAQTPVTSPKGLDTTEGNNAFNWGMNRRFMSIDATQGSAPLIITALAMRRDAAGGGGSGAGTMTVDLYMGLADLSLMSVEFDRNYLGNSKTQVHAPKAVNVPNWIGSAGSPAPFDFVITLDQPYIHLGTNALVWDMTYTAGTVGSLSVDRDFGSLSNTTGTVIGTGCTSTGANAPFTHKLVTWTTGAAVANYGLTLQIGCTGAPANAAVVMHIDSMARGVTVPGLCTTIEAFPTIALPLGSADATGLIPDRYLLLPWSAAIEASTFVSQLASLDPPQPGAPFSLSNGVSSRFASGTGNHAAAYLWAPLPGQYATGNFVFPGGTVVVQLR